MCEKNERKMKTEIMSSGHRQDSPSFKKDKQHENIVLNEGIQVKQILLLHSDFFLKSDNLNLSN